MPDAPAAAHPPPPPAPCLHELLRQAFDGLWSADIRLEPLFDRLEDRR